MFTNIIFTGFLFSCFNDVSLGFVLYKNDSGINIAF